MTNTTEQTKKQFDSSAVRNRGLKKLFNFKNLNKFLFAVVIAGGVYYLTTINDLIAKGFKLNELKQEYNILAGEAKDMETKVTYLQSCNNLSQRAAALSMVAVSGEIDYISVAEGSVAMR